MKRSLVCFALFFLILSFRGSDVFPWGGKTHVEITHRAINISHFGQALSDRLGLSATNRFTGLAQFGDREFAIQNSITPIEWVLHGSEAEDELLPRTPINQLISHNLRADNHYYNPFWDNYGLYPFGHRWLDQQGGLHDDLDWGIVGQGLWFGKPSPEWAYNGCPATPPISEFTSSPSNFFSWTYAKKYFYAALSGNSWELDGIGGITGKLNMNENERGRCYALLFRSLGQLMHLIQDAGVPEHTRNDAHPMSGSFGFERYAYRQNFDDASWSEITVSPNLIVKSATPILDFFDSNRSGEGYSLSSTGLAEYSNFNFLTKDSISENALYYYCAPDGYEPYGTEQYRYFTHPMINHNNALVEQGHYYNTYYFWSEPIVDPLGLIPTQSIRLAKRTWYHRLLQGWGHYTTEDERIRDDYLRLLIPKCIGYSAAMLDYFFRGDIDMVHDEEGGSGYVIVNKSPEEMEGLFEIYYDNEADQRIKLWEQNFALGATGSEDGKSSNVIFNEPSDAKNPGKYMLVFRGRIGGETDAVVGKITELGFTDYAYVTASSSGGTYCIVWDIAQNRMAEIPLNSGGFAAFPCLASEISNWLADMNNVGQDLFSYSDCGNTDSLTGMGQPGCYPEWTGHGESGGCTIEKNIFCPDETGNTPQVNHFETHFATEAINHYGITCDDWYHNQITVMQAWRGYGNFPSNLSLIALNETGVSTARKAKLSTNYDFYRHLSEDHATFDANIRNRFEMITPIGKIADVENTSYSYGICNHWENQWYGESYGTALNQSIGYMLAKYSELSMVQIFGLAFVEKYTHRPCGVCEPSYGIWSTGENTPCDPDVTTYHEQKEEFSTACSRMIDGNTFDPRNQIANDEFKVGIKSLYNAAKAAAQEPPEGQVFSIAIDLHLLR